MDQTPSDFEVLYQTHRIQVYGFIRARAEDDAHAEDISLETWLVLSQKLPSYDPSRASFLTFARYWAGIMLLRHYHAQGKRRKVEALMSSLCLWFPELQHEAEVMDIMAPPKEPEGHSAADVLMLAEAYDELLQVAFQGSSPPHQLIAFGFCKLLEWRPRELVTQHSDMSLRDLVATLVTEYLQKFPYADDCIRSHFEPLRKRMDCRWEEVAGDDKTLQTYGRLRGRIVGDTTLADYLTNRNRPTANISHWWLAVRRRIWSTMQQQGSGPLAALIQKRSQAGRRAMLSRAT